MTSAVSMMVLTDASTEDSRCVKGCWKLLFIRSTDKITTPRSRVFFLAQTVLIVAELIGPLISSRLMEVNLWIPILIGLACTVATMLLAGSIPETLESKAKNLDENGSEGEPKGFADSLKAMRRHISTTFRYIVGNRSLVLLVITFLVVDFSRQSLSVLLQYISTRYSLTIAKVSFPPLYNPKY